MCLFTTILFDIDGVLLSEERYFDASGLTVYELLCSPKYLHLPVSGLPAFHVDVSEEEIRNIRSVIFADDRVLHKMKRCGVNANWDMVYLQTAFSITQVVQRLADAGADLSPIRRFLANGWTVETMQSIGEYARTWPDADNVDFASYVTCFDVCRTRAELFQSVEAQLAEAVFARGTATAHEGLWMIGQRCFQAWYLGEAYDPGAAGTGKSGFLRAEVPLVESKALAALFQWCLERGFQLGIGTGRSSLEAEVPLAALGLWRYFEPDRITTATDVLAAQKALPDCAPLSKPHPFSYLRSLLGERDLERIVNYPLPLPAHVGEGVLVVGDSVADGLAAQALGCRFAAVLTGLEGKSARSQFEAMGTDYILDDVLDLQGILFE